MPLRPLPRNGALLRWAFYGLYALFGVLHALTWSMPLATFEIFHSYERIHQVWASPSWAGILRIPYWSAELGAIPLFFVSTPFLWALGPCLAALQLGALLWSLAGLLLIERALPDPAEGLLAASLAGLGLHNATEIHLGANGGHPQFLLPFGLALFLTSRFLQRFPALPRSGAFWYGLGAAAISVFMPPVAAYMVPACLVCLAALKAADARRLVPPLLLGVLAGAALALPLFWFQPAPMPFFGFSTAGIRGYPRRLAGLLAGDWAAATAIYGNAASGYAMECVLLGLVFWAVARGLLRKERLLLVVALWSLVMPLLLPAHPWYLPEVPSSDALRFRYFAMAWPAWSVLLGIGALRLWRAAPAALPWQRVLWRAPFAAAAAWLCAGATWSYVSLDYCQIGAARQMPLSAPAGRIMAHYGFPGAVEREGIGDVLALPQDLQASAAAYLPMRFLVWPWREPEALPFFERVPPALRQPFAFGAGFVLCEASLPVAANALAQLPQLGTAMSATERAAAHRGCETGRLQREGRIALRSLAWPIEAEMVRSSSCRLLRNWQYHGASGRALHPPRLPWEN